MSPTVTRLKRKPTAPATAQTALHAITPAPTKAAANQSVFDQLPDSAWLRESQLVRKGSDPASTAPLPFSAPTLWRMVKAGKFPSPAKLSTRVTAWKCADVRAWMTSQSVA